MNSKKIVINAWLVTRKYKWNDDSNLKFQDSKAEFNMEIEKNTSLNEGETENLNIPIRKLRENPYKYSELSRRQNTRLKNKVGLDQISKEYEKM